MLANDPWTISQYLKVLLILFYVFVGMACIQGGWFILRKAIGPPLIILLVTLRGLLADLLTQGRWSQLHGASLAAYIIKKSEVE